jgi:hypothetical protein
MGYDLRAFVGPKTAFDRPIPGFGYADAWALRHGFALLPLSEELDAAVAAQTGRRDPRFPGLPSLSDGLAAWAEVLSHVAPIAYLEIECFGGDCERGTVVWESGRVVLGPFAFEDDETAEAARSRWEILHRDREAFVEVTRARLPGLTTNQALRRIGVVRGAQNIDEFTALDLGALRHTSDWRHR